MSAAIAHFPPPLQGLQPKVDNNSISTEKLNNDTNKSSDKASLKSESAKLTKKALAELSRQEQAQVRQLKNRDTEVKIHEQAHLSAAGTLAVSGASFSYTTGPDGVRYATGGEVSIDTSKVEGDPQATIKKAETIRRAALAPATPSAQDQAVAAQARAMSEAARAELIQQSQQAEKTTERTGSNEKENQPSDSQPKNIQTQDQTHAAGLGSIIDIFI